MMAKNQEGQVIPASAEQLEAAIELGIERYFARCSERIPSFTRQHFWYPGVWHLNRHAFGFDLIRAPLNLLWAPFYTLLQFCAWLARVFGAKRAARILRRVPGGLTTRVQRELTRTIRENLLTDPGCRNATESLSYSVIEAIRDALASEGPADLARYCPLHEAIDDTMQQYAGTRLASADISNSLMSILAGAFAFKKFTPGGIAIGLSLAGLWANHVARNEFILGDWLGGLYYSAFPTEPSATITGSSILIVLCALAAIAAVSGLITDPMQAVTGIHQRRLRLLLKHLKKDILAKTCGGYRPKDHYLARLLETVDAVRANL